MRNRRSLEVLNQFELGCIRTPQRVFIAFRHGRYILKIRILNHRTSTISMGNRDHLHGDLVATLAARAVDAGTMASQE